MASIVNNNWITGKWIITLSTEDINYQISNLLASYSTCKENLTDEVTDSILMSLRSTGLENLYKKFHQMAIFQLSLFTELIYSEKK